MKTFQRKYNYLDLFSGIGGFHEGFLRAGFQFEWTGHVEIDSNANSIYEHHFPESEALGDIKKIKTKDLPNLNIVTFGFPCQDLSMAGKRKGLSGTRSNLFFTALSIIEAKTPEVFIFENVKGLFSSGNGKDFETVLRAIVDLGIYECEWQLLNTRWVLPQNRERIYFVGHRREGRFGKVFPIGTSSEGYDKTQKKTCKEGRGVQGEYSSCLRATGVDAGTATYLQVQRAPLKFLGRNQKNMDGDYAFTIDTMNTGGLVIPTGGERRIRRFTPLECSRLQGFNTINHQGEDWCGALPDTIKYQLYGNAVSVPIVEEIGRRLLCQNQV